MWLVASAQITDLAVVRDGKPALWRDLRRFNAPIQLAVAAAHDVVTCAVAPTDAAIISLAPCQAGSPELHRWVREIEVNNAVKVNPTHTLHAVDNLALSVLSIALANHAWGMSIGGAAGMAWTALELVLERDEHEVIVLAGDQVSGVDASPAAGVAMLFARERTPHVAAGRATRLIGIDRRRVSPADIDAPVAKITRPDIARERSHAPVAKITRPDSDAPVAKITRPDSDAPVAAIARERGDAPASDVPRADAAVPHAAAGAMTMLAALRDAPIGHFAYVVPAVDGDGVDEVVVRWEVSA